MSRTDAVEALYQDMAARHRARFRSIHVSRGPATKRSSYKGMLNKPLADSPRCRAREGRRHPSPIHQAARPEGSQVPAAPPRSEVKHKENLQRQATFDFCLKCSMFCRGGFFPHEVCGVTGTMGFVISICSTLSKFSRKNSTALAFYSGPRRIQYSVNLMESMREHGVERQLRTQG